MANNPFDRTIINLREKPLSQDVNQAQSQLDLSLRNMLRSLLSGRTSDSSSGQTPRTGFLGSGLRVTPASPADLTVTVLAGIGFIEDSVDAPSAIDGIVGLDDLSAFKPVVLLANHVFTVPTPPGANSRIDIIEVRTRRETTNPTSRLILNPSTGAFAPATVDKTLAFTLDGSTGTVVDPANSTAALSYKQGTVAASPVAPPTSPGYTKIAEINVGTSAANIDNDDLVDLRRLLEPGGVVRASMQFRLQWNGGGGAQIVTTNSVNAPPGIRMTVVPINTRGMASVVCLGSGFTKAAGGYSMVGANLGSNLGFFHWMTEGINGGTGTFYGTISATEQGIIGAAPASPVQPVGVRTPRAAFVTQPRFFTTTGPAVNQTDANLEDLSYHAWFDLAYH